MYWKKRKFVVFSGIIIPKFNYNVLHNDFAVRKDIFYVYVFWHGKSSTFCIEALGTCYLLLLKRKFNKNKFVGWGSILIVINRHASSITSSLSLLLNSTNTKFSADLKVLMKDNTILKKSCQKVFCFYFWKHFLNNSIYYLKLDVTKMKEMGKTLCWRDV